MRNSFRYLAGMLALFAPFVRAQSPGAVYTQTNSVAGNSIMMFARSADGRLGPAAPFATGGIGTGTGLGSQGAVITTQDGQWLFTVNAGSNDVSTFSIASDGTPTLRSRVLSGGIRPTSLTVHGDMVVVLNAGGTPNISAFHLDREGNLMGMPGGTANILGGSPGQVQFDDHGELLVVSDRTSQEFEVFRLGKDDGLQRLYAAPSAGVTPFGFAFAHNDVMVVSEAGSGSASSYQLNDQSLTPISAVVTNAQRAACWVVITNNGKYAFTANAGSRSISSYALRPDGSLTLIEGVAANTPPATNPTELALSRNSSFLYSLATGTVSMFRVGQDGALTSLGVVQGMPATLAGLAAR